MRHVTDQERRDRIARRHALAPGHRLADPVAATEAMTVLHATEAPSVYLSLHARVDGLSVDAVDRALYDDRSLVKQLAMRRTLFVFPRDLLPAAWGSAAARVARAQHARLVKDVERAGIATDGEAWLAAARAAVLDRLADGSELSAQELREQLPELAGVINPAPGRPWGRDMPIAPRVLTQLGLEALLVRAGNAGHWRTARPRWTLMDSWLGEAAEPAEERAGYAELVRRWLVTFGPGTAADLQWWLGSTATAVRHALADAGAVEVALDRGATGWLLPDDPLLTDGPAASSASSASSASPAQPWVALLPVLDPTVMGWKERDFYLGPHGPQLFDTNGNAGTTAWCDGRVVGCWVQDADGAVVLRLLEDVGADGRAALVAEAERLTAWLGGHRVSTIYSAPAMKEAARS